MINRTAKALGAARCSTFKEIIMVGVKSKSLFFPTRFGFLDLIFSPVWFGQKKILFGSPLGQNYFYSGQFQVQSLKGDLIFLNLIRFFGV